MVTFAATHLYCWTPYLAPVPGQRRGHASARPVLDVLAERVVEQPTAHVESSTASPAFGIADTAGRVADRGCLLGS